MFCVFLGSPGDRDNLEVGDEIMEVNGVSLEDATRTEVLSHFYQVNTKVHSFYSVMWLGYINCKFTLDLYNR